MKSSVLEIADFFKDEKISIKSLIENMIISTNIFCNLCSSLMRFVERKNWKIILQCGKKDLTLEDRSRTVL